MDLTALLDKYGDTIKSEVNVKEIENLEKDIEKFYKPIGSQISQKFGKDTGNIIRFAKQWNVEKINDSQIKVYDEDDNEWVVDISNCDIEYRGLDGDDVVIDKWLVVKMDLDITEDLKKQWILREISRFLNQLRKKAEYNVDDRVNLKYFTKDTVLSDIVDEGSEFLEKEALLSSISLESSKDLDCDVIEKFECDEGMVWFGLIK